MSPRNFLILAQPRSRTAWLAAFFASGPVHCHHDGTAYASDLEQFSAWMSDPAFECVGNSDSAQVLLLPALIPRLTSPRLVVVRRPLGEVVDSFTRAAGTSRAVTVGILERTEDALDQTEKLPEVLRVEFRDLSDESCMRAVWSHCTADQLPFPLSRWQLLRIMNIALQPAALRAAAQGNILNPYL